MPTMEKISGRVVTRKMSTGCSKEEGGSRERPLIAAGSTQELKATGTWKCVTMKYALSRESAAITGVSERLLREGWLRCWMSDHLRVRFAEAAISGGLAAQRGALIIPNDPSLDPYVRLFRVRWPVYSD